jgi:DNA modification methylase
LIEENGWYGVIVAQRSSGRILAGNHRWRAAKAAGMSELPVAYLDVDDDRAERILLADNRSNDLASYDDHALADLLQTLTATDDGLLGTGYDGDDLDQLLRDLNGHEAEADPGGQADRAGELQEKWDTALGQVWVVGRHRVVCGDSRDAAVLSQATNGERVGMLLTDPPYGINLDTDYAATSGSATAQLRGTPGNTYRPVIGDDEAFDPAPLVEFFTATAEQFWFGADYYRRLLSDDDRDGSWLVWDKRNEATDAVIGSGFELVWSRAGHKRDLLRHFYAGAFGADARDRAHPTQKPVPLLREMINRWAPPTTLVADPYLGSGSTLVACEHEGHPGCGVEIDPAYVAVTLERLTSLGLTPEQTSG